MPNFRYFLLALFLLSSLPILSQHVSPVPDTIPFVLTAHNNISIKGILNSTDTLDLMFHTAASSLTVISEAADRLNSIEWTSETDVNSWGGGSKARFSRSNSLSIGRITRDSIAIWETQQSGPGTEGKFGPNLFAGKVIDIDFDQQTITVSASLPDKAEDYQKLPLLFQDGFMFIEGTSKIGGQDYPNHFLIHTGYGGTILYDDEFVEKSRIGEQVEIIGEKALKDSYGNTIITRKGTLPEFKLGTTVFTDLPVGFFAGNIGRQKMSVLGGDLLKRFNILLDAERTFIYLKENERAGSEYSSF